MKKNTIKKELSKNYVIWTILVVINIFFGRFEQKLAGFRAIAQSFIEICQKLFHTRKVSHNFLEYTVKKSDHSNLSWRHNHF